MSDKAKAVAGVDQEGSTARTNTPASDLLSAIRRGGDGYFIPANDDTARLDWLQRRGRVKARRYGDMKDNFTWDCSNAEALREAIDAAMLAERIRGLPDV